MKCFYYEIRDGNELIIKNWINRNTRAEALRDLKEDYQDANIKLKEVYGVGKC